MRNRARSFWLLLLAAALWLAPAASAVTIDWVYIGSPGNSCDTQTQGCFGSVSYSYYISKYEVTNAQYVEFLNAKAASDQWRLYNENMNRYSHGGITRSGSDGSWTYSPTVGAENNPVAYVSFYSGLRFTNWMHNGQGSGDTETGAYTLLGPYTDVGYSMIPSNGLTVARNSGANIFLTSEDEWYKAAYYDPIVGVYNDYSAGTDTQIVCAAPGPTPNTANCSRSGEWDFTDVGSYTGSASPYGTFDQGGNVFEWTEAIVEFESYRYLRSLRGGGSTTAEYLAASVRFGGLPENVANQYGFRVAMIPEPGTALLVMTGLLGLAYRQRRHGRIPNARDS